MLNTIRDRARLAVYAIGSRAARRRDEGGYALAAVLGIVVLVVSASVVMLGTVRDQVISARNGDDFTTSRQAADDAAALALRKISGTSGFNPAVDLAQGATLRDTGVGVYSFTYSAANRTLTATGSAHVDDTGQSVTVPLRSLFVGSKTADANGNIVYGVAANGLSASPRLEGDSGIWSFGLASAAARPSGADTTIRGSFYEKHTTGITTEFDYALLGGKTTLEPTTTGMRVTAFSDGASVVGAGWSDSVYRSKVTLQYDLDLLRKRASDDPTDSIYNCLGNPPTGSVLAPGGLYCARGSYTLPSGLTAPSTGVATIVVNGDLTIPSDISLSTGGQVHIYVTGNVTFTKTGTAQKATNLFVYAPSGDCSTSGSTVLQFTGALACRSLYLPSNANTFTYVSPSADASLVGAATTRIFYTESAGYTDFKTP